MKNLIRDFLTVVGGTVVVLWICASLNIGNFIFYYGPDTIKECKK